MIRISDSALNSMLFLPIDSAILKIMWLFLWVIFVLCAAGFFVWSYYTTFEQKKAWKAYAQKYNLTYIGGRLLESPEMTGEISGRQVNFYPMVVENAQGRMFTYNVIEVFLKNIPDVLCVVTTQGFQDFIRSTGLTDTFIVTSNDWPKNILAYKPEEEGQPEQWFLDNPQRVEAIRQLNKLPFHIAFVADGQQAFIALRTMNPLSEPTKLNQLVRKIQTIADMMECQGLTAQDTIAKPNDDKDTDEPETSEKAE